MNLAAQSQMDPQSLLDALVAQINSNPYNAEAYFALGNLLQQHAQEMHSDQAVDCWIRGMELCPHWRTTHPEWVAALRVIGGRIIHKEDRFEDGMQVIKSMLLTERETARNHPLGAYGLRILSNSNNPAHLGHAALEPDLFLKMSLLGWQEEYDPVMVVDGHVANPTLLDYWRKYIRVVTDPVHVRSMAPLRPLLRHETWYTLMPDGSVKDAMAAMSAVQKEWESQNRPPLLSLTDHDYHRGRAALTAMGLPPDAWFVCLHVREAGFYNEGASTPTGAFRNADILSYRRAIETVTSRGGWVIRMGDASMKPLPPMRQVVDYARSPLKTDWMDVFLCAQCKFFLGTTSGLMHIPNVFGVPCAITNWSRFSSLPPFPSDLFICKLPFSAPENRLIPWIETVHPPYAFAQDDRLKQLGFDAIDNTEDEINELVIEMLDRVENKATYSSEDEARQSRAKKIFDSPYSAGSACRMGRDFLRRYAELLPS